jgi:uncharacterized protein YecT (DUF1311 family)
MRIHSLDAPDTREPGIAGATVELIETDLTESLRKVIWANSPEPVPGIGQTRTMRFCIGCIACVLMLLVHTEPGLTETGHNFVTRVYVGNAGRTNEDTQDVHIVYNNGADVVAPKEKDQPASTNPAVANDKRTVGWLAEYWIGGQSYPGPTTLVIYRDGHIITTIEALAGIIWDWRFFDNGNQVGFTQGVTHGTLIPQDYRLYDVSTGALIQKIDKANEQSPDWVKALVRADASAPASIVRAAEDCDVSNRSQAELNNCYGNVYKASDAQLNALYKQIEGRLKDDKETTKLLVSAERAWVAFRDAECDFLTSGVSGGTVYPMIHAICLDRLTSKRFDDFKTYLKCQEGALDCPVPAQ